MDQITDKIKRAVSVHLPRRTVQHVQDRGVWERHIVKVTLDGGEIIFFKIQTSDWNITGFESLSIRIFQEHDLPAPRILAADTSGEIFPCPYIIQEWRGGTRLGRLLDQVDDAEAVRIYETLLLLDRHI